MTKLTLWKNQEMNKLRKDIDHLFARLWSSFSTSVFPGETTGAPFINLSETEDALTVEAELPGINPEDLDISVINDILTIRGEKFEEAVEDRGYYHRVERRFGSFSRAIRLPCSVNVEEIKATYKKGVLNIFMPKCKPEKTHSIKIEFT